MLLGKSSKNYLYASLGMGVVGLLFIFILGSAGAIIGGFLVALGCLSGVVVWKYGYLVIPLITQKTNVVMLTPEGYEIPSSQDVIVKNVNGVYYASSFLSLKIFESVTEKTMDETISYSKYFERAISNLKYVTKISYMLYVEDIRQKRQIIETKRAESQLRLSRERDKPQPDPLKIDRHERELAQWDNQLTRLIKGVKPMGVIAYAMTTAAGISKEAAIAKSRVQAQELRTLLANSLNVEVAPLQGDEMLKCFEWEMFYPTTVQEIEESVV